MNVYARAPFHQGDPVLHVEQTESIDGIRVKRTSNEERSPPQSSKNLAARLKRYQAMIPSRPEPKSNEKDEMDYDGEIEDGCICYRPIVTLICTACQKTFRGRVAEKCLKHPNVI